MNNIKDTLAYKLISNEYQGLTAKRSGVPLINHIDEGIDVLMKLNASLKTIEAYCIHPLLQGDTDLKCNYQKMSKIDPEVIVLAMEYRFTANDYLSNRTINSIAEIKLSILTEVNQMLVADKIQNYKDFLKFHFKTHPRSNELDQYFKNWLQKLKCEDLFKEFI